MLNFLKKLLIEQLFPEQAGGAAGSASPGSKPSPMPAAGRLDVVELARRLGVTPDELRSVPIAYRQFQVSKRRGGTRTILAPADPLKAMQRRILRRLLRRLKAHPCVTGFERGHSIVTNALPHVGRDVVIKLDLKDFFSSTSAARVEAYFRRIGWDADAAALLARLCTHQGALPQGAPTSPRLSNLVNYRLDARLAALAESRQVSYSRYADDITLSGDAGDARDGSSNPPPVGRTNPKTFERIESPGRINDLIHTIKTIVAEEGYVLHTGKKLRIARRGDRQLVTGIVVNEKPNLPRATRRRLRAVEHRLRTGRDATLTPAQLAGWRALQAMVENQRRAT
jgi:retron-type reverse transcriptase